MPELPEVETIRRELEHELLGKRIRTVEVFGRRSVSRHESPEEFIAALEGKKLAYAKRRGKYLLIGLDAKNVLVVHLGMSGQLLLKPKGAKEPLEPHTHVVIGLSQGFQLRFVDPRTFGEMFVVSIDRVEEEIPELAHLGFDPLETVMSWTEFGRLLMARKTMLKPLLMDQRFVAGIGNIYSDEILFAAGLRYDRSSDSLTAQEIRRLYRAMVETLTDALKHKGSSLGDEQYKDIFGDIGEFQSQHRVYGREGKLCRRCRSPIVKAKVGGRSTYYCEKCQV